MTHYLDLGDSFIDNSVALHTVLAQFRGARLRLAKGTTIVEVAGLCHEMRIVNGSIKERTFRLTDANDSMPQGVRNLLAL
jgi:hypothetical protein